MSDIPTTSNINVIPGSIQSPTGKWMGGFSPSPGIPNNADDRTLEAAAKLWIRKVKNKNPSLIGDLKGESLWSCRKNELAFWQTVASIIQGEEISSKQVVTPSTYTDIITDFPSDQELESLDLPDLLEICEALANRYPVVGEEFAKFKDTDVFSSVEYTRIFLINMKYLISPNNKCISINNTEAAKQLANTCSEQTGTTSPGAEYNPPLQRSITPTTSAEIIPLLIGDLGLRIVPRDRDYVTEIVSKGEIIVSDSSPVPAFHDDKAAKRISLQMKAKFPEYDQKILQEKIASVFATFARSPDSQKIMSDVCKRIILGTKQVKREMTSPPVYHIIMDDMKEFHLLSNEISKVNAPRFNEQWFEKYHEILTLNRREYLKVLDYWLSIATEIEPVGCASPWEPIVEDILTTISHKTASPEKEALGRSGLYLEANGPLWVANTIIHEVMRLHGKAITDPGLVSYMKETGYLIHSSKTFRVGSRNVRAWGLDPGLKTPSENNIGSAFSESSGGCEV